LFVFEYFRVETSSVRFSNVSSSSVTVSWNTKKETSASVIAFEGDMKLPFRILCPTREKFYDTRDVKEAELMAASSSGQSDDLALTMDDFDTEIEVKDMGKYYTHHVTVTNLDPEKEYSFVVGDKLLFRKVEDVKGQSIVKTFEVPDEIKSPSPAYSSVKNAENSNNPIDKLAPVTDGVVYFNFFDENTGIESNLFSSTLNEQGNWYIDTSMAVGPFGEPYLETYDTIDGNLRVDLVIDAGPLGEWAKKQSAYVLTPGTTSIINIPDVMYDYDVMDSLVPLDIVESEEDVKGEEIVAQTVEEEMCEMNGLGTWNYGRCNCVSNAVLNTSRGVCSCRDGYHQDGNSCVVDVPGTPNCSCGCPPGYSTTKPDGSYTSTRGSCNDDSCTKPFCYKEIEEDICTCSVYCGGEYKYSSCPPGEQCESSDEFSCTRKDQNGNTCEVGGKSEYKRTCYKIKETSDPEPEPIPDPDYKCVFYEYCPAKADGCYKEFDNGTYEPGCDCPEDELKARNCIAAGRPDPETFKCAGGTPLDQAAYDGSRCLLCEARPSGSYYIPAYEATNDYEYKDGACVRIGDSTPKCKEFNKAFDSLDQLKAEGKLCEVGTATSFRESKVSDTSVLNWDCLNSGDTQICMALKSEDIDDEGKEEVISLNEANCDTLGDPLILGYDCYKCQKNSDDILRWFYIGDYNKCKEPSVTEYYYISQCKCLKGSGQVDTENYPGVRFNTQEECSDVLSSKEECKVIGYQCNESNIGSSCRSEVSFSLDYNKVCTETGKCKRPKTECRVGETIGVWGENGYCKPYTKEELCYLGLNGNVLYHQNGNETYQCSNKDGVWQEIDEEDLNCEVTKPCEDKNQYCYDKRGNLLKCEPTDAGDEFWDYVRSVISNEEEILIAAYVDPLLAGDKCDSLKCLCMSGPDKGDYIEEGYCRSVTSCYSPGGMGVPPQNINNGKVCSTDGFTCEEGECDASKPSSLNLKDILGKSVLSTHAQSNEYILDPESGIFTEISVGTYVFEYEGNTYAFTVSPFNSNPNAEGLLVYIDQNGNGEYDENTDIEVSDIASQVNILTLETRFSYTLNEGLNFVSLPFLISDTETRTAASLLRRLNQVYSDSIYSISKFDGGQWKIVGQNTKVYDNNDFQLLPGEGYVIKAKRDINIKIVGQPVQFESESDSAPINLNTGWNLIGLYGTNVKSYTAKSLLQDINTYDFRAINVTQWAKSKQLYEGFQLVEGKEYGFDYPLNTLESYFVRITEGSGNWQPQLGGNN
jgi:hypothetical protein